MKPPVDIHRIRIGDDLKELVEMNAKELWALYQNHAEIPDDTLWEAWYFCDNEKDANALAELTLKGVKSGTASMKASYEVEGEPLPTAGKHSVVTDWDGNGVCVIRVEKVEILPFNKMTETHAVIEGEGDQSLEYWRTCHRQAFTREADALGFKFSEETQVVFEIFRIVYPE